MFFRVDIIFILEKCSAVEHLGDDPFAFGLLVAVEVASAFELSDRLGDDFFVVEHELCLLSFDDVAHTSPGRWLSRHDSDASDERR